MNNPFLEPAAALSEGQPNSLQLATVAGVYEDGLSLIPDAQAEATQKHYKYLSSAYPSPAVGDRVVVMKMSGTYVVMGSLDGHGGGGDDGKVSKTGDTMTGNLTMENASIVIQNNEMDIDTHPESNLWTKPLGFRDADDDIIGRIQGFLGTNGMAGIQIYGDRLVNGSNVYNYVGLYVKEDGTLSVGVSSPAAWRAALGLGTNGAFPLTVAQGGTGYTSVTHQTTVENIITAAAGFTISTAAYYSWGKIAMLYVAATATSDNTTNSWHTVGTLVSSRRPVYKLLVNEVDNRSAILYSNGNLNVFGTLKANFGFEFSAVYLT